ncbi:MAG: cytochrome c oxidase accessory protein CcoG [Phycisphaerae bacterium]|nr:cytochrome c oxidase accessory protein CcoG [Phycisphaerae bacterium]
MRHENKHSSATGERVLATLNPDGSRHWIRPRLSIGRYWHARRIVAYGLIVLFAALPFVQINGKPAMLLDVVHRRFHLFGATFLPTDTALMAVLMLVIFLGIFLITALLGRVWCGWACPQTVYMEFLYRPIERLIDGAPGSRRSISPSSAGRGLLKFVVFFICSCFLAHTFLAYFVGVDQLRVWITRSPFEHPASFLIMAGTTALMLFDFGYFREQTCLVACPYGRFQSALTDRNTMIISYDSARGEPRGKLTRSAAGDVSLPIAAEAGVQRGDCIDCRMCVTTCPTGIDIRDGLQMECIGCAQCIDACDVVMDRIKRPRGLIRYSSAAVLSGERAHILRPRIMLYPMLLAGFIGLFVYLLVTGQSAEAAILPRQGAPFYALPSGAIANQVRLRIVNRSEAEGRYTVSLADDSVRRGARLAFDANSVPVAPAESVSVGFVIEAPPESFSSRGALEVVLVVSDGRGFSKSLPYRMLGPVGRVDRSEHDDDHHSHDGDGD